jgi:hypothetical protein
MTDQLELQVRTAVAQRMEGVSPDRAARLRARNYRPGRRRLLVMPVIGAVAAVLLLSSGTPAAFAGWTATPSSPTAAALAATRRACGNVPAADVLAAEARGPYTAVAFKRDDKLWQCVVKGSDVVVDISSFYPTRVYAPVPAEKVMLPVVTAKTFGRASTRWRALEDRYQGMRQYQPNVKEYVKRANAMLADIAATTTGPNTLSVAIGAAGSRVTGVTFVLADGDRVHATVTHGWYVAWWPGAAKPGGAAARRVAVTTSSGTRSSSMPAATKLDVPYQLPAKGCVPGDRCSVFVPLELAPAIAPSILKHFAMFQDTPPAKQSTEPEQVRSLIQRQTNTGRFRGALGGPSSRGVSLGLDPMQVRSLNLGAHDSLWLIPGREGFCEAHVENGNGGSSCGPASSLPRYGSIMGTGGVHVHGSLRYLIGGFVPNGNRTVTIVLDSGASHTVRVTHNAFVAAFSSPPASVTFKDAPGKTYTDTEIGPNWA